ncbi:MAG: hypothetical protein J6U14_01085 [Bacteroidaceae bacterium]|nr:hypothetical protein [Bacteroidaceae bacterium]
MKSRLFIVLVVSMLCGTIFAIYLHYSQEPLLMYREQQQIFLWDGDYMTSLLKQVGGFATLASQFLVQFFLIPWVGAITTALITTITGFMLWMSLNRILNNSIIYGALALLASYLQGIYLLEMGYHYEGLIAMLCFSLILYAYLLIYKDSNLYLKTLSGIVFTLLLYFFAGSIATLFAVCALIADMLQDYRKGWISSLYLLTCFLAALVTVSNGSIVGYDYALWTKGYYEYHVEQGIWQSISWIVVPIIMIAGGISKRFLLKPIVQAATGCIILMVGGLFLYVQSERRMNRDFRTLTELMLCINQNDWEGIINNPNLNYQNYLHLNCINLALSHEGKMMTDLFKYPQKGAQSLMVGYQAYNDINVLFSHIYYHTGVISEALCLSFGTMIATTYGNPSLLKMLVKERLIYGDYQVAEKYITRLEKTYAYQEWATDMRRFLNNDQAVENDPELGKKRKSLPSPQPRFVVLDGIMADLVKVTETGTDEGHALEYAMAMMMLDKNMDGVRYLSDRFLANWQGDTMPELMQEAVVILAEHDEEYCRSHGVTDETANRFMAFKQAVLNARRSNVNQQAALSAYRNTYWYYYMFG